MSEDDRYPGGSGYNQFYPFYRKGPSLQERNQTAQTENLHGSFASQEPSRAPFSGEDERNIPVGSASNAADAKNPAVPDEDYEEDPTFTYKGMQIVRGEYFSHMNEPAVTFVDSRVYVNTACIRKAPDVEFIQILINPDERKLVIRPSAEDVKDSFCWRTKRGVPKHVGCPILFAMLVDLLGWDPECRYKILGKRIKSEGEYLFSFNLENRLIFRPTIYIDEHGEERRKASRTPIYNDDWKNQFGLPVDEHQRAFQVNIFDGYAVFGIKGVKNTAAAGLQNSREEE